MVGMCLFPLSKSRTIGALYYAEHVQGSQMHYVVRDVDQQAA